MTLFKSWLSGGALTLALALTLLTGCSSATETASAIPDPQAFHSDDECHVCGMTITRFPGPKGEAMEQRGKVRKFCSVSEMINWWLQPDNQLQTVALYVHDMANNQWDKPDDARLVDARSAYYVMAPEKKIAMGMPLAVFANKADAEAYAAGNRDVMDFEQLAMHLKMAAGNMSHGSHQH